MIQRRAKTAGLATQTKLPHEALILLPVRNVVLFPGLILPIVLGRGASIAAAQEAVRKERPLGVILQKRADVDAPGPDDLYRACTGSAPSPTSSATSR